jgi:hypothetical protein
MSLRGRRWELISAVLGLLAPRLHLGLWVEIIPPRLFQAAAKHDDIALEKKLAFQARESGLREGGRLPVRLDHLLRLVLDDRPVLMIVVNHEFLLDGTVQLATGKVGP